MAVDAVLLDNRSVSIVNSWKDSFSVSVLVEDLDYKSKWLITSVYGPNEKQRRHEFWRQLEVVRGRLGGAWCIGGD